MYYLVLRECTFNGVTYQPGQVINVADPEVIVQVQRELRGAIVATDDPTPQFMAPKEPMTARPVALPIEKSVVPPIEKTVIYKAKQQPPTRKGQRSKT